ncbi:MAG TPA: hypothetical protein VNF75_01080 [Candidatus Dormibacteraeota bacterium]|nr:hypothetical protein [Candidatus Dormibacteraeota bacterium]
MVLRRGWGVANWRRTRRRVLSVEHQSHRPAKVVPASRPEGQLGIRALRVAEQAARDPSFRNGTSGTSGHLLTVSLGVILVMRRDNRYIADLA